MIDDSCVHIRTTIHLLVQTTALFRRVIRDGQLRTCLVDDQQTVGGILLDGEVIEVEGVARVRGRRIIYNRSRAREIGQQGNLATDYMNYQDAWQSDRLKAQQDKLASKQAYDIAITGLY